MKNRDIKDLSRETRIFINRSLTVWVLALLVVIGLGARVFYLQVLQHEHYATISEDNRILLQPLAPNRGLIYDRKGKILADNRASHSLNITLERVEDLDVTLAELSEVVSITQDDIDEFRKRLKQSRRPFQSIPLRFKLSEEEIAQIAVRSHHFPGVSIEADLVRYYPLASTTGHVLGYVGRISEDELKTLDPTNYSGTQSVGKIGLEKFYESELHGTVGYQKVEVNARGRVLRVLERVAPVPGADVKLYLDSDLQAAAETAMAGRRGAIVAMDPNTGGVLALVSSPGYDTNLFVTGIGHEDYRALNTSPDKPLINRALRGKYPPGSTLKPLIALAALEAGYTDWEREVWDPGWYQLTRNGRRFRDHLSYGHGKVNLLLAIAVSCDTYFYELAHRMGVDTIHDFLARFGLGQKTILDSHEALSGILPSTEWKRNAIGESWYTGETLSVGIGQGYMTATPLELATATMVLANRGRWVQPRFMQSVGGPPDAGESSRELKPLEDVVLKYPENWERMVDAMEGVVHGKRGSARALSGDMTYRMAGKSGTVQLVGIKQDEKYDAEKLDERLRDNAMFVAFAPADEPRIAVAVVLENAGGGSSVAGPLAKQVIDAYLLAQDD